MEKWLKDAREKVKGEAEMALWSCKRLAETESLEKDWVIEEFLKEFNKIKNKRRKNSRPTTKTATP